MAENRAGDQGKLDFVRQILERDPTVNEKSVNEAWQAAGRTGRISRSSVGKVKAQMGLTGSRGPKKGASDLPKGAVANKPRREQAEAPRQVGDGVEARGVSASRSGPTVPTSDRAQVLEELEGEIDRVLFRVMGLGDLDEIEKLLRRSRRLLVRASLE